MSVENYPFCPNTAYVIALTTATTNQALTQPSNSGAPTTYSAPMGNTVVDVYNANASKFAYLQFGMTSQTATTSSIYQVPPATSKKFKLTAPYTNVGAILDTSASASNLYLMLGDGGV